MNTEHPTLNIDLVSIRDVIQFSLSYHSCRSLCIGTNFFKAFIVILAATFLYFKPLQAQSLIPIHSGLEKATSLYVTQNEIYIVEQGKDRVLKLDHSGKVLDTIGGKGSGNYQFSKPVDVDATNGLKVFVSDFNNRRIQVFDRRGQYLSSISASDAFGNNRPYNPTQIAVNGLGEVFFVDEAGNYIRRFDLDSNLLDEFRISSEINSVDEMNVTSREILILDKSSKTIHRLSLNGNYDGFYPAEDVKALFASESGIWKAYSDRLEFENRSKQKRLIPFTSEFEAVDMHVLEGVVFILSADELYKLSISE
ncbi:hypothetical protein [Gracilimonas sp. BCB1]|uniref:hypothetical protein n=1 Tax=Gracilimonas sp. BCB1 TaxID=3152362 RepID=UPI0032D9A13F